MNNRLRSFSFVVFLCAGFFSCKASTPSDIFLDPKENSERFRMIATGAAIALGGKYLSEMVCSLIPALRPWVDGVQFSFLLSGNGKELKLSNNAPTVLISLYAGRKRPSYKPEFLVGAFVVGPLIETVLQYVPRRLQDAENNNSNN